MKMKTKTNFALIASLALLLAPKAPLASETAGAPLTREIPGTPTAGQTEVPMALEVREPRESSHQSRQNFINSKAEDSPGVVKCKSKLVPPKSKMAVTVLKLSDGDTMEVLDTKGHRRKVRFLTMDAPETHFMGKSQGKPGDDAAARLAQLLPEGSKVTLEFDVNPCDVYGRHLAFVRRRGIDINRQMIAEGFAAPFCYAPALSRCDEYLRASEEAGAKGVSLFANHGVEVPHEFRIRTSGNIETPFVADYDRATVKRIATIQDLRSIPTLRRVFFTKESEFKNSMRRYKLIK